MKTLSINSSYAVAIHTEVILDVLKNHFKLEFSENPEFLITGWRNIDYLINKSARIKILSCAENCSPNFNYFDYALGTKRMEFGDRYFYYPFAFLEDDIEFLERRPFYGPQYAKRKFANFIAYAFMPYPGYSKRENFVKFISKYKTVDCPGRRLNNMQATELADKFSRNAQKSKINFLKN
ncbi:MAG: hypothetical protein HDQ93_05230, partial [Desulfovibrio sp.]|nr:hypothetical protein [Desulfovibrio sp.]